MAPRRRSPLAGAAPLSAPLWDEDRGYAIAPAVLGPERLDGLRAEAERLLAEEGRRPAGVRRPLARSPVLAEAARSEAVAACARSVLGPGAFVVRSLLFDKAPGANWDVGWHQDTTIAVAGRHEREGFGPWSVKRGVPHVQPPIAVLERMVTVRLHLDACGRDDGPLLVVPGSHRHGIGERRAPAAHEAACVVCEVPAGGAVLMRPLVVHASRRALRPTHRRVLHLEYACDPLPAPLRWALED